MTLGLARSALAEGDIQLLMFEQAGCHWCERWDAEVGTAYPLTPEGIAAPLQRLNLRAPLPPDLQLASQPRYTPTFVLISGGIEVGRIEGYPGEDFFWGLLGRLLNDAAPES